ncbi:unnamed protein product [Urochloa humidicola]
MEVFIERSTDHSSLDSYLQFPAREVVFHDFFESRPQRPPPPTSAHDRPPRLCQRRRPANIIVVCESSRFRCMKVWLKGEKAGQAETFVDNLPGCPDIRLII